MIADLKPYPEYKESGLPWLGQVPGHWEIKRLKSAAHIVMGQSPSSQSCSADPIGLPFLQGCAEFGGKVPKPRQFCSAAPKEAPPDAILLSVRAPVGRLNLADQKYGIGRGLCAIVPQQETLATLYARYAIEAGTDGLLAFSTGSTYGAVSVGDVGVQPIPLPPPAEQAAIVRFLDSANGRLEQAIRAKRKVIALLNEQKQVIIHRAVTRGLDHSVPLKPSGIPWLGDIPRHWDVERTKNVFRLRTQKSGLAHGKELLSIYTHIGVRPRKDLEQKGNKASTTDDYWIVRKGDLIVNKLLAWMGAVGSSDYEGVTSPAYDILMPIRPLCSNYYHHLFRTKLYLQQFKQRSRGIMDMRLRLYFDQLGQIPVPFPPVDEQAAIVAFYVEATADLTATISRFEREIELLREYRTRLVADVVTGKLDVREAAARLPDETEEPELLDEADALTDAEEDAADDLDAAPEEAEA